MQKYEGPKYVVVTGGVMSGVGKGITTASMGKILLQYGYNCTAVKIDPYLNYDAGTMRPTEHGEVWVTDDGGEIDQDLDILGDLIRKNIKLKNSDQNQGNKKLDSNTLKKISQNLDKLDNIIRNLDESS